jgi:hypothetical protein
MKPELAQRVAAAWHEVRSINSQDVERYLDDLRLSDPELAGELGALLARHPSRPPQPVADSDNTTSRDARWGDDDSQQPAPDSATESINELAAGATIGRFQLVRLLGRGGFGEVWQAYDPVLDKHVAVKAPLVRPGRQTTPATFLLEARRSASLRHPAIVHVYDVGESTSGWYIVSEFIDGESLRDRLRGERLPFDRSARLAATVAGALHAAHLAGIIHRDVKPANILLDRAGNAYLTDFGLAVREDEQAAERWRVSGTLAYMSPEQISGDTHLMDGRADIYALGAVFYELLTGRPLVRAGSIEEYRELVMRREPRPPRAIDDAIPAELERICLKCLAKEPRDRYRTAQDLANDLNAWLAGPAPAPAAAPPKPAGVPVWLTAALTSVVVAALVGVAALSGFFASRPAPDPVPKEPPVKPAAVAQPTVKPLIWPRGRDLCTWEVSPRDQLKVHTDSTGLFQVGKADADSWTFTATLRQLTGVGRIGLFLGYREDSEAATASFELIHIDVVNDKAFLLRSVETYRLGAAQERQPPTTYGSVPLGSPRPEYTLRLVVRANRLHEVRLNGAPMKWKAKAPPPRPTAGAFGVYNRQSDGVFSKLLFNDNPIPLTAPANARAPE